MKRLISILLILAFLTMTSVASAMTDKEVKTYVGKDVIIVAIDQRGNLVGLRSYIYDVIYVEEGEVRIPELEPTPYVIIRVTDVSKNTNRTLVIPTEDLIHIRELQIGERF